MSSVAEAVAELQEAQRDRIAYVPRHLNDRTACLSDREREVVALLLAGMSNAEIADELTISIETVKNHVTGARKKAAARNRTHLAVIAAREQGRLKMVLLADAIGSRTA